MGENFALRWNDFHSNLESLFKHLRSATEYQDVTLVCGREAAEVRAHKVRGAQWPKCVDESDFVGKARNSCFVNRTCK